MYIIHKLDKLSQLLGYSIEDIQEVIDGIKKNSRKYYYSYIDKKIKNGKLKLRPIDPSREKLRDLQNKILSKILATIPKPEHLKGSIKGRNNVENVRYHRGNNFHFQTDLINFFGFVTNKMVFEMFRLNGYSPDVAHILTQLTTFKGHLPQGAPTSPTLANLVGLNYDKLLLDICIKNNLKYTRYVDDLWFSANYDFKFLEADILKIILESHFLYSHKKTLGKIGKIEGTGCLNKTNGKLALTAKQEKKLSDPNLKENSKKGLEAYKKLVENT